LANITAVVGLRNRAWRRNEMERFHAAGLVQPEPQVLFMVVMSEKTTYCCTNVFFPP